MKIIKLRKLNIVIIVVFSQIENLRRFEVDQNNLFLLKIVFYNLLLIFVGNGTKTVWKDLCFYHITTMLRIKFISQIYNASVDHS